MSAPIELYSGAVIHRRLRPRRHSLRHACFWMLVDIDHVDEASRASRLFSHNRFNILSFRDSDHGDGEPGSLREQIEGILGRAGIAPPGGAMKLFCMPRVLGYGFNPLSVYFCNDEAGVLRAIVYEVHNTFSERYFYAMAVETEGGPVRHACDKNFYVSPFMDMEMSYDFRVERPGERIGIAIHTNDHAGPMLTACLSGIRRDFSDANIARVFARHPLLTLKVVAAIHVHAALLWWKGVSVRRWKPGLRRVDTADAPARAGRPL